MMTAMMEVVKMILIVLVRIFERDLDIINIEMRASVVKNYGGSRGREVIKKELKLIIPSQHDLQYMLV